MQNLDIDIALKLADPKPMKTPHGYHWQWVSHFQLGQSRSHPLWKKHQDGGFFWNKHF